MFHFITDFYGNDIYSGWGLWENKDSANLYVFTNSSHEQNRTQDQFLTLTCLNSVFFLPNWLPYYLPLASADVNLTKYI